jgi:hypothetical protein
MVRLIWSLLTSVASFFTSASMPYLLTLTLFLSHTEIYLVATFSLSPTISYSWKLFFHLIPLNQSCVRPSSLSSNADIAGQYGTAYSPNRVSHSQTFLYLLGLLAICKRTP